MKKPKASAEESVDAGLVAVVSAQPGTIARLDPKTGKWAPFPMEAPPVPKGNGVARLAAARKK